MSIGRSEEFREVRQNRVDHDQRSAAARSTQILLDRLRAQFPELATNELLAHIEGRYDCDDKEISARAS